MYEATLYTPSIKPRVPSLAGRMALYAALHSSALLSRVSIAAHLFGTMQVPIVNEPTEKAAVCIPRLASLSFAILVLQRFRTGICWLRLLMACAPKCPVCQLVIV